MKRITSTALFTLAVLVTAALVPGTGAMAQGRAVRATVPFDFTVGDKLLPAGTYTDMVAIDGHDRGSEPRQARRDADHDHLR